jgi:aspartyl-tRNA synthetase
MIPHFEDGTMDMQIGTIGTADSARDGFYEHRSYCGEITPDLVGRSITVFGWADSIRDHGGIIFIEIRDVSGRIQTVFDSSLSPDSFRTAESFRNEFVLAVTGTVRRRSEESVNPNLATGEVEIVAERVLLLNTSTTLPFGLSPNEQIGEEVRLRYRFLDLRRDEMRETMVKRHRALQVTRNYLDSQRFLEIETPVLNKSTPEGARDFLVPSRLNRGLFYALPQSPQLFKQILMVSGFDRYFQVVKCFRDEDLRNDRQPEFTQVDMELSFVDESMVMKITEGLVARITECLLERKMEISFRHLPYDLAMRRYGTDKPDLRYGIEIEECSDIFSESGFNVFSSNMAAGGVIRGIAVPDDPRLSRLVTDGYSEYVKQYGAGGLPMCKYANGKLQGGMSKFISDTERQRLIERFRLGGPAAIFFSSDREEVVNLTLAGMRDKIARDLGMVDDGALSFAWITEFPLLEYSEREKRYVAMHHPFTAPLPEHEGMLEGIRPDSAGMIKARSYDLVLNGVEIGGGSIRINRRELQNMMFNLLGISPEEASERFSFLLNALQYGAPPHGGIALGLDRILMVVLRKNSIREVIAFPKTQKGQCLMSGSPTEVTHEQLRELSIRPMR